MIPIHQPIQYHHLGDIVTYPCLLLRPFCSSKGPLCSNNGPDFLQIEHYNLRANCNTMGNSNCSNAGTTLEKEDILDRELKMYRWRAENTRNCLPRLDFKHESCVQEQEKLKEFISKYQEKDYLQLHKLRKELESVEGEGHEIIVFEKYACGLKDFRFSLFLEEVIYTLLTLLTAFEEIRTMYKCHIPVSKECCFVTMRGEVRGWINSNPKSNQVDASSGYKCFGEREYRQTVAQIVALVEQTAVKDMKIEAFIATLKSFLFGSIVRGDIFQKMRTFIQGYCQTASFQVSSNLAAALRRSRDIPILKFSKKNLNEAIERRSNSSFHSRNASSGEDSRSQRNPSWSFDKGSGSGMNTTVASFIGLNQSVFQHDASFGCPVSCQKETLTFRRFSNIQAPKTSRTEDSKSMFRASQVLPSTPKPRASATIQWALQNKIETSINDNIGDEILSIPSMPSNKSRVSQPFYSEKPEKSSSKMVKEGGEDRDEEGTLLEGKFLTSKQLTSLHTSKIRRGYKYKTANVQKRPSRQISILDIDIGEEGSDNKENGGKRVHFHTFQEVKTSETSIEPQRPWLTNKTITQLLSNKEETDSLVHSLGSSSEDRTPSSSYSGALSGMGRNVNMTKKEKPLETTAH